MDENEITLSQYFSVIKINYKKFIATFFLIVFLISLILIIFNFILIKKQIITIEFKNKESFEEIIKDYDFEIFTKSVNEYAIKKNIKINNEDIINFYNKISLNKTNNTKYKKINAYDLEIYLSKPFDKENIKEISENYIKNLNLKYIDKNDNLKNLNNYFITFYGDNSLLFDYNENLDLIENLLDLNRKKVFLTDKIDNFENDFFYNKNFDDMCFMDLKTKIEILNGNQTNINSIQGYIWYIAKNSYTTDIQNYGEKINKIMNSDEYGIKELENNLLNISAINSPELYNFYKVQLTNLGKEVDLFYYKNQICKQINLSKAQIISDISNVNSLGNKFNALLYEYNNLIENYPKTEYIIKLTDYNIQNKFSIKKIILIDTIGVFIAFVILYFICFESLNKKDYFSEK